MTLYSTGLFSMFYVENQQLIWGFFFVSTGVQRWVFRDEFYVVLNEYLNVSNLNI